MYNTDDGVCSNEKINPEKLVLARKIITKLQQELPAYIERGSGPFLAAIYDAKGNLIAKEANSVVRNSCSHNHAEMNAIRAAEEKLGTYDFLDPIGRNAEVNFFNTRPQNTAQTHKTRFGRYIQF